MFSAHRRTVLAALLLLPALLAPRPARATWSIVVLDRARRWIGVAGASCTPDVYGILSLRPGQGVLVAQAIGHDAAIQRANQLLAAGVAPDSVLHVITAPAMDSAPWFRQYAAASVAGDSAHGAAQFTGDSSAPFRGARRARDGTTDVLVQGNSLPGPAVLDRALAAIEAARHAGRPIYDVLMSGLAAGAAAGGDVRCGPQRATSAFLVVARPGDRPFLPYLTLAVFRAERGGPNPVDLLRTRLARWEATGGPQNVITNEGVQPPSGSAAAATPSPPPDGTAGRHRRPAHATAPEHAVSASRRAPRCGRRLAGAVHPAGDALNPNIFAVMGPDLANV